MKNYKRCDGSRHIQCDSLCYGSMDQRMAESAIERAREKDVLSDSTHLGQRMNVKCVLYMNSNKLEHRTATKSVYLFQFV